MTARQFDTINDAKEFFVQRLCTEAGFEGSPFKGIEIDMLKWSPDDLETDVPDANLDDVYDRFSDEFDRWEWEGKIQRLLINAYERDLQVDPDAKETYKAAYRILRKENHYILKMIEPALGSEPGRFPRVF